MILLFACVLSIAADLLFVIYGKRPDNPWPALAWGLVLIVAASTAWARAIVSGTSAAMAITFYAVGTICACSLLGWAVFKEPISVVSLIGIGLSVIGVALVGIGGGA